ncbi:MAG: tetratricopeptide repeat protein [Kofleriaceae bacterium]
MTAPKWLPSDDELDGLARTLEPTTFRAEEAEQHRTSLLASAAGLPERSPSNRAPLFVAIGAVLAAAAAVLLWIALRSDGPKSTASVTAIGEASFEQLDSWPTYSVRIGNGRVRIDVIATEDHEDFIARTSDAELEIRRATLEVNVANGRLDSVAVSAGRAELRLSGAPPVYLSAGDAWRRTLTAEVLTPLPPPTPTPDSARSSVTSPVTTQETALQEKRTPKTARVERSPRSVAPALDPAGIETKPPVASPPAPVTSDGPNPGELEFRAGMAALRSGDAAAAATSFAAACSAARGEALAEDACFWVGAAANRAGEPSVAREALTRFVQKFASSARVGEASALLGWLLYDAGELDAAEAHFQRAASDRVPRVKASADKGLEAIKRRRATR